MRKKSIRVVFVDVTLLHCGLGMLLILKGLASDGIFAHHNHSLRWGIVKLFRSPYDEAAALGRMDPVALSSTLLRSSRIFSGSGKTMVVFFSTPISVMVWR